MLLVGLRGGTGRNALFFCDFLARLTKVAKCLCGGERGGEGRGRGRGMDGDGNGDGESEGSYDSIKSKDISYLFSRDFT